MIILILDFVYKKCFLLFSSIYIVFIEVQDRQVHQFKVKGGEFFFFDDFNAYFRLGWVE